MFLLQGSTPHALIYQIPHHLPLRLVVAKSPVLPHDPPNPHSPQNPLLLLLPPPLLLLLLSLICNSPNSNLEYPSLLPLPAPLRPIHSLLTQRITHSLAVAPLPELPRHRTIHIILRGIDVSVPRDLRLGEFILRDVAGLVLAEPAEDVIFDPGLPGLLLARVPGLLFLFWERWSRHLSREAEGYRDLGEEGGMCRRTEAGGETGGVLIVEYGLDH